MAFEQGVREAGYRFAQRPRCRAEVGSGRLAGWGSPMVATRGPGLVGRSAERALLDGLLERVRVGESEALVIRGEAGIGKSASLRYAARQASGFQVARLTGVEAEMELPFAGVHQLFAALPDRVGTLPAPQREALTV